MGVAAFGGGFGGTCMLGYFYCMKDFLVLMLYGPGASTLNQDGEHWRRVVLYSLLLQGRVTIGGPSQVSPRFESAMFVKSQTPSWMASKLCSY